MNQFVTIDEASLHLRRDTLDDDTDLQLKINAASEAIFRYLRNYGSPWEQATNSNGDPLFNTAGQEIPALNTSGEPYPKWQVKAATLLLVGELYKQREGETAAGTAGGGYGYLPPSVTMLLANLRDPVMA